MSTSFRTWLQSTAQDRHELGLARSLHPRQPGVHVIDVASNDYLGLARDPRVIAAAQDSISTWGTGSTGSRLVTGTMQCHVDLEAALAEFLKSPAALVFASGYAANLAVISGLGGPGAVIVSDAANHASIVDACRLSRSRVEVTPHGDLAAVDTALARRREARALVVTDAVFSTDGELAPVAQLHELCRRHDAMLVVDEAHSLGVVGPSGRGLVAAAELAGTPDVVRTVTLSKALGSQGGAVLAGDDVIEHLINTARTFIFDTGLAPGAVGAAAAALQVLRAEPERVEHLHDRAHDIADALGVAAPHGAVISLVLRDPALTLRVAEACRGAGVLVGCFRPPSVPVGESRIRLTARATLSKVDVKQAVATVLDAVATAG